MKKLLIIAVVALLAAPAIATGPGPGSVPTAFTLATGSCPVNLKVMPTATIVAPAYINVAISTISTGREGLLTTGPGFDGQHNQILGSSSGLDYGTFLIGTNLASVQITATIGTPGLSGGAWACHLQGVDWGMPANTSTNTYPGPIPDGTPFNVFVQVTGVNMTLVAFSDAFNYDTTLTLTLSIP